MIRRISSVVMYILPFLILCSNDGSPGPTPLEQSREQGEWSVSLPIDTSGNTVSANLEMKPDQSFEVSLEHSEYSDILFTQSGTYLNENGDSITFLPESCSELDSTSGELVPLADSLCTTGFTVPGPNSASEWTIGGTDLGALLDQLPLSDEEKSFLHFFNLRFTKSSHNSE